VHLNSFAIITGFPLFVKGDFKKTFLIISCGK